MKTTFIYALCEPGTRTIRYIGKTANPKKRIRQHLRESVLAETHLGHWLCSLCGASPDMVVLREATGSGSDEEKRYIRLAKGCGIRLVNGTEGGDGGSGSPSLETRGKISAKLKGRYSGDKNPFFGRTHTPESREAIGAVHKGIPLPVGHPFPGNCKGKTPSTEHRENLSKALTGLIRSPEHCANLSKALMGRKAHNKGKRKASS